MFKRFLCPPEMVFSSGEPTLRFRVSLKPILDNKFKQFLEISSSDKLPKHNLAL